MMEKSILKLDFDSVYSISLISVAVDVISAK